MILRTTGSMGRRYIFTYIDHFISIDMKSCNVFFLGPIYILSHGSYGYVYPKSSNFSRLFLVGRYSSPDIAPAQQVRFSELLGTGSPLR